ncbi:hypothetical protein D3C85_1847000 [compost metagenome]
MVTFVIVTLPLLSGQVAAVVVEIVIAAGGFSAFTVPALTVTKQELASVILTV